jgi:hypothetical protein
VGGGNVAPAGDSSRKKSFASLFSRDGKSSKSHKEIPQEPLHMQTSATPKDDPVCEDAPVQDSIPTGTERGIHDNEPITVDIWGTGNAGTAGAAQPTPSERTSLLDEVRKISSTEEGSTLSYFSAMSGPASAPPPEKAAPSTAEPPAVSHPAISSEPVVGWLVCVSGVYIGNSFHIYAGKNTIGRGSDNRLVLAEDCGISRSKHAIIVYEPKKRNFFLQPGDSKGLTYLNDDYVDQTVKLKPRDLIEIGSTKLLFVPLCDDSFSWEDYLNKE